MPHRQPLGRRRLRTNLNPLLLRRGRIGRNGGQVFNLPPNVSTPGRNVSTLGRNVSTFANQVSTFPDPTVVRFASSGPLLPNPGRPSAHLSPRSRPPPTGRARHPGRETPGRIFQYPPSDAGPTPFVVSRPGVFGRSCRTTQPPHPSLRAIVGPTPFVVKYPDGPCPPSQSSAPTPFVVSRGAVPGRSCRTTTTHEPSAPSTRTACPSQSSAPPRSW